jgi:tetratricopeptide (TPR) repeat protein
MFPISIQRPLFQCLLGLCVPFLAATGANAQNVENCGTLSSPGQFGPFDYRTERGNSFHLVESAHFTPEVEALVRGKSTTTPGPDIDYTLRAFPNNHRALIAIMRLGEREKTPKPSGSRYTVECWFERAIQFRPDDSIVRMIYSTYLNKAGKAANASAQLDVASTYAKDNAFTHYNIGLHYFDLKNYDKALVQAHKAMDLGFPQTALRDQLQSVGKWSEPVNPSSAPLAESPSSAPAK